MEGIAEDGPREPWASEGEHIAPAFQVEAFHCPHCGVLTTQHWHKLEQRPRSSMVYVPYWLCRCENCQKLSCWLETIDGDGSGRIVDPVGRVGPHPHIQMPADVRADYEEARAIAGTSPRGACALERLAVQKLVNEVKPGGGALNEKIGCLVEEGLPETIQQALDVLRVVGNNAVHPGELDLQDDVETAVALMDCMNLIVEERIARRGRIRKLYEKLPEGAREAIERRDARS